MIGARGTAGATAAEREGREDATGTDAERVEGIATLARPTEGSNAERPAANPTPAPKAVAAPESPARLATGA